MKIQYYFYPITFILLTCCWLVSGAISPLNAQMTDFVNSLADDSLCYPWDDPETELDETSDGVVEDLAHRKTLRAAILESYYLNDGAGGPAIITITVPGTITLNLGTLYPTDGSTIKATANVTIAGGNEVFCMNVGNNTTIRGLAFTGGLFSLGISGDGNKVYECWFENAAYDGIVVAGNDNVIGGKRSTEGNFIGGMSQHGISVTGDWNWVQGNYIGMLGTQPASNGMGIFVTGSYNMIGWGIEGDSGNVICSNTLTGISLVGIGDAGVPCKNNKIFGNYIGTTETHQSGLGNSNGIEAVGDSSNIIKYNVICGNTNSGILVGINSQYDEINGNFIGVDTSGQYKLPNGNGITLGPKASSCYVVYNNISGNTKYGVQIAGGPDTTDLYSNYHEVYGNTMTFNGLDGVIIGNRAEYNIIGSSLTVDNYPNRFHRNGRNGVTVASTGSGNLARLNTIRKNSFLDNGNSGIYIEDSQDLINPPVLVSYHRVVGLPRAVVVGSHDLTGSRIDFYTGEKILASRLQGRRWLDDGLLGPNQTDFNFTIPISSARYILATATDQDGNTSEFSDSLAITTSRQRRFRRGANSVSMSGSGSSSPSSSIPGSSSSAYSWSGGSYPYTLQKMDGINSSGSYTATDTLVSGVGYWIKCDNAVTDSVTEFLQIEDTVDVVAGWNFIGSVSDPIPVSHIVSIPGGMVTSQFFGYESSYVVTDTIQPGFAYWVKVNTPGSLVLAIYDTLPSSGFITIVPDTALPPPPPPEVLGNTTVAQVALNQGWNMVSVPINALDFHKTVIFPDAISNVFSYTAGQYASEDTLSNGAGYWVKYGSAMSQDVTGYPLPADTFDVTAGWNLIGSIGNPVAVSQITSTPGGMIASQFFGYDLFYSNADTLDPGKAYWVKVNESGQLNLSSIATTSSNRIVIVPTEEVPPSPPGLNEPETSNLIPETFALHQNYPNPFNPSTTIRFDIAKSGFVSLKIYNVLGKEMVALVGEQLQPGTYWRTWNAGDVPSGVYFYRLTTSSFTSVKKMLLAK